VGSRSSTTSGRRRPTARPVGSSDSPSGDCDCWDADAKPLC
jgi:hypothetical protein